MADGVLSLQFDNIGSIVRHQFLLRRVIRVTCHISGVLKYLSTSNYLKVNELLEGP